MELQREQPPPYQSHNPEDFVLPSVPQSGFVRCQSTSSEITLPDLRSVLGDLPTKTVHPNVLLSTVAVQELHSPKDISQRNGHRTLPRPTASPKSDTGRPSLDSMVNPSDTASVMSVEEQSQRSTSVSLEDPDVRLAAEALSGLGRSYGRQANVHSTTPSQHNAPVAEQPQQQEPLLCLLPGRHPWVGSTINGSLSAYNVTKNFTPGFVRYGVELAERSIGSPLASTVSNVAKRTGVENGLRKYLSSGQPSQTNQSASASADYGGRSDSGVEASNKRRRVTTDQMGIEHDGTMHDSIEDLPPYRMSKPPSYREELSPHSDTRTSEQARPNRTYSPAMTVAGLYVAMSDASLRSLKYCITLLVRATEHVETVMNALKKALLDMDRLRESSRAQQLSPRKSKEAEAGVLLEFSNGSTQRDDAEVLAQRIQQYCDDIMNTLKTVVNTVSTYAGGALPENARAYIRQQLLSVPQRWLWATQTTADQQNHADGGEAGESGGANGESRRSARRMIAFATEGIDMMQAINTVIQNTCMEAERWMDTLPAFHRGNDVEMMDADDPK